MPAAMLTTAAGVSHVPSVVADSGGWRVTCTCGHQGEWRNARRLATADWDAHLIAVTDVPAAERCTQPRAHRTHPWDRCPLCAGQLDLFDAPSAPISRGL